MPQNPGWYYNEFKQIGVDYTDLKEVETYDLNMQKLRDIENEAKGILELLKIKNMDLVLEIGTGTGELALKLSGHCKKVVAIDVSRTMIYFAKTKAESQKKTNIEFHNAGFLTYENHDEPFDAVVTQLALHHLPDYWKMIALKKIYGMLKGGGRLYLRDVVFPSLILDYEDFFSKIITDLKGSLGDKFAKEMEIHIREEFSTLDWIMEGLLKNAGFCIEFAKYDGLMASYLCKKLTSID